MITSDVLEIHTSTPAALGSLEREILTVLAYFDIFNHPLTAREIYNFLPSNSTSAQHIEAACRSATLSAAVSESAGHFSLRHSVGELVRTRRKKEQRAARHTRIAHFMARLIRRFPFVRGVFMSGELSKGISSADGDIDFVIVTAPNRLWVARSLLTLFKKTVLLNRKRYFCLNHFITETNLHVGQRNLYTAIEVVTLKPLYNGALYDAYQAANRWTVGFLPNYPLHRNDERETARSFVQQLGEWFFSGRFGDALDERLMQFWKRVWARRYSHLTEEQRSTLFQVERDISTAYAGDFLTQILSEHRRRLRHLGLNDKPQS
jgi:hypothetical protein